MRFSHDDVVLLTKTKGTDEPLAPMEMSEIAKHTLIPDIDHNVQWKRKLDRPAFRQVSPQSRTINLKSLGGAG